MPTQDYSGFGGLSSSQCRKVAGAGKGPEKHVAPFNNSNNLSMMQIKHHRKKNNSPPIPAEKEAFVNDIIDKVVSTTFGCVL